MRKWTEVNIHVINSNQFRRAVLSFVKPFVKNCKRTRQIDSWHFFLEECPLTGPRHGELEIRLRFYGESIEIDQIKNALSTKLEKLARSRRNPITFYHFGNHGRPGKYRGERANWRTDWPIVVKQYNFGSEYALQFLSKRHLHRRLGYHGHRYVHLLLNQLLIPHSAVPNVRSGRTYVHIIIPQ